MKSIVFDIGGTFVKYGASENGAFTATGEFETRGSAGAQKLMQAIRDTAAGLGQADAVGICTRGQVNCATGTIIYDPPHIIPGYTGTNLIAELACFHVPVAVENDVNCMALAEAQSFPAPSGGDLICLTYGTCVGGAIVRDGKVYHGANWSAGEFGMLYTGGQYYEDVASVTALVNSVCQIDPALSDGRKIAAALGRPEVSACVLAWAERVAEGIASLIHCFDPAAIVIGGGFIENERILPLIRAATEKRIAPGFQANLHAARHGNKAGLMGAALLAERLVKGGASV